MHILLTRSNVHERPREDHKDDCVKSYTRGGGTPGRPRDCASEKPARELEHFGARYQKEEESRHERNEKLLLLLFTVAATATIFENTHIVVR